MATVGEVINKVCSAGSGALGMNLKRGALQVLVKADKALFFTPGTELDPSREFDAAYFQELQIDGKVLVVDGIQNFAEVGNDDNTDTKTDDTQIVTNEGKYKFELGFNQGIYRNRQLESLQGFGKYATAFIDREGNWLLTKSNSGGAKGYRTGQIKNGKYVFGTTQAGEESKIMFQWLDRFEFDRNYVFIPECEFNGDYTLLEGISQVSLSLVNTPSNTDTTITFKAVLDQDQKTPVTGLDIANVIRFRNGGTAQAVTPVATSIPGVYTATVTAVSTDDLIDLKIHNSSTSKDVIKLDDYLYKSALLTATVV
ncbi:hypothetical protein [Aquimarina sp. 2201CG5-10]|uniref:hypothetical protein n=1 Tax=Aquimarina callyspongiae TaxID=3098150 RepID=UPI002AB5A586|nr:hypothetical protein [Aquimarina sp. 2201CG5-10]MDY8137562.1 hypothetical protein [Aquimarina sp. 2201CG5-10]